MNPFRVQYSAYWWARRRGWENIKTFEAALEAEEDRINQDWFKWRQCAYKLNSSYAMHIESIISMFDVKQVHCILTDKLKVDAGNVCQKLFESYWCKQ